MKRYLLRVQDGSHRRLVARARRDGRSVNALANEILRSTVDADPGNRRERLRARASALGMLQPVAGRPMPPERRREIVASTRGLGPVIDRTLAEERDRC